MPSLILTVTLNPAIDKIITLPKFKIGMDFRALNIILNAGGKGLNVSRALKNFGIQNVATGILAGSSGEFVSEKLRDEQIDQDFTKIKGETRTNLTIIAEYSRTITRILEQGPQIRSKDWSNFKKSFAGRLKGKKFVVFSGSNAAGLKDSSYRELIEIAHKKGVKAVVDTSGQALKEAIKAKPYSIKPNLEEAEFVLGKKLRSTEAIKEAIWGFHKLGVGVVVISQGHVGAMASDGKVIYRAIAPSVPIRNNVGCGDALIAGLLFGECHGWTFKRSFQWAVAAGSANALQLRPGDIDPRVIQRLLPQVKVEPIGD